MKLNIREMVITVSSAIYLKKKGAKQQSLFYWIEEPKGKFELAINRHISELIKGKETPEVTVPENAYSAFTTDELILVLENSHFIKFSDLNIQINYRNTPKPRYDINEGWNIGEEIAGAIQFTEEIEKETREERAKRAPQSPKNPNTNGNFR